MKSIALAVLVIVAACSSAQTARQITIARDLCTEELDAGVAPSWVSLLCPDGARVVVARAAWERTPTLASAPAP